MSHWLEDHTCAICKLPITNHVMSQAIDPPFLPENDQFKERDQGNFFFNRSSWESSYRYRNI